MQWKLNKMGLLGGLVVISGIAQLHADASLPSSTPPLQPPTSAFIPVVSIEALFWNARQEGLVYTLTNKVPVPPAGIDPVNDAGTAAWPFNYSWPNHTKEKLVPFGWDWGFRLAVGGFLSKHGDWDISLQWTYYRQRDNASTHQTDSKVVAVPWSNPLADCSWGTSAKAHWHLRFDTLDLQFGRAFWISDQFYLRPHADVRAGWIRQNLETHYKNVAVYARAPAVFDDFENHFNNNFSGAGLRMGLEPSWTFAKHWKLYGDASAAFLYGRFHYKNHGSSSGLHQDQWDNQVGTAAVVGLENNVTDNVHTTVFNLDLGLGIAWDYTFSQGQNLALNLGYEYHLWFDQNQTKTFVGGLGAASPAGAFDKSRGDLSLMGLTFGIKGSF